jgi:hypothetical protein
MVHSAKCENDGQYMSKQMARLFMVRILTCSYVSTALTYLTKLQSLQIKNKQRFVQKKVSKSDEKWTKV